MYPVFAFYFWYRPKYAGPGIGIVSVWLYISAFINISVCNMFTQLQGNNLQTKMVAD